MSVSIRSIALAVALAATACTTTPRMPLAPAELQPPSSEVLLMQAFAGGVQIYECAGGPGQDGYQWRFKGPDAELTDGRGQRIGSHYVGPTWESLDGSKVVAEVKMQAKSADASAIPLLLLETRSTSGAGMFASVRSIQRLDTAGGRAPSSACTRENFAQVAKVPYTATYYFYGEPR